MVIEIVLSDLDSTLCDTLHRENLAPEEIVNTQNWIPYSKACIDDTPVAGVSQALKLLSKTYPIFYVSGRNVEAMDETVAWLDKHGLPHTNIKLHSETDIRHNGEYKVAWIQKLRANGFEPILMFEDHVLVAKMVEAIGVPVVTIKPHYDDKIGVNENHLTPESK